MAGKKELTILISHDGTVTVEVEGAQGASCLDLTRDIEQAIGLVREREKKAAFYEGEAEKKARREEIREESRDVF
jgi:hypothetical protein